MLLISGEGKWHLFRRYHKLYSLIIYALTFFTFFKCFFLSLREKEHVHMSRGGAERGSQRVQSRLCTENRQPNTGLELKNPKIMT